MTSSPPSSRDALLARLERRLPGLRATWRQVAPAEREGWLDLIDEVAARTPRLLEECVRATAAWVGRVDPATLTAWVRTGLSRADADGWRGARRARAFFAAADVLGWLDPSCFASWAELAPRFGKALDDARFFQALDPALAGWRPDEQSAFLAALGSAVRRDARGAAVLYREFPNDLARVDPELRASLLTALAAGAHEVDLDALLDLRPLVPALLGAVPTARRASAAGILARVGAALPTSLPGLLRSLPRVIESAPDETRLRTWVDRGIAIATENPDAGCAFFALESRTSTCVLTASPTAVPLGALQGELRKFVQMLSGEPAMPVGVGTFRLRAPFEPVPAAGTLALPDVIDLARTWEDNARLHRVLAALAAGRREAGTYADAGLADRLAGDAEAPHLDELVRLTDGYRVAAELGRRYAGLTREIGWAAERVLAGRATERPSGLPQLLDALLALALIEDGDARRVPAWLAAAALPALPVLRPLARPGTTIDDAVDAARRLLPLFEQPEQPDLSTAVLTDLLPLLLEDEGEPTAAGDAGSLSGAGAADDEAADAMDASTDLPIDLEQLLGPDAVGGTGLSADELARLIEATLGRTMKQARGETLAQRGLYVTQLLGKLLGEHVATIDVDPGHQVRALTPRWVDPGAHVFLYDEWDHLIGDYRPDWCRLREIAIAEDAGVFFERTLARHADLVPEIRRHFQRVRPESYRTIRGLEDGQDFDLGAVVDARAELRARHSPSPKLYTARVRQERDVATLFLLDLSASTDEQAGEGGGRIIDVTREALVLMAAALDEIGDAYAIYGFSGQGRDNVEFFPVKSFAERLSPAVKGRIGGLEPRGSTRMGTALRHAVTKMRGIPAPSRHLLLLSDGFPQDLDYGQDRHSHTYGIRDTATALREASALGIRPFCLTVDAAGHDYLRQMCDPNAYMVIDDVADLPRQLPKIYQRLVWGT